MRLQETDIIKNAYNSMAQKTGKEYFLQNRVMVLDVDRVAKEILAIRAQVEGNFSISYHPSFSVCDGQIERKYCDCPSMRKYGGGCRHIVAAAYAYLKEQDVLLEELESQTDDGAKDMIRQYQELNMKQIITEKVEGRIRIEPTLEWDMPMRVTFRLGEGKLYVIKNMMDFANAVENGQTFSYGKNLEFNHNIGNFMEEYRPIVEFILAQMEDLEERYQYFDYFVAKKDIALSKYSLEEFLKLCVGMEIVLNTEEFGKRRVLVKEENPQLVLQVDKKTSRAYRMSVQDIRVFSGAAHLYVWKEDILYQCDKVYSKKMRAFLEEITNSLDGSISINEKDMQLICSEVLPCISDYVEIETKDISLEEFLPPEAKVTFYLDAPSQNTITCRTEILYGEQSSNPFEEYEDLELYRDLAKEFQIKDTISRYLPHWNQETKECSCIDSEENVYDFLTQAVPLLHEYGTVMATDRIKIWNVKRPPKVTIGVSVKSELLQLDVNAEGYHFSELKEMLDSYQKKKKYYRLKSGEFVSLENESFETLSELIDSLQIKERDLKKGLVEVPLHRALYLDKILKENEEIQYNRDVYFKEMVRNIKAVEDSDYIVPNTVKPILRSYQKIGYRWLRTLAAYGFGGILADDMGLGKTLQMITFLLAIKEEQKESQEKILGLIVCPASLIYNWESELERFAPELSKLVITGSIEERRELILQQGQVDVMITSFDLLRRDIVLYEEKHFYCHIIDEAQFIKNHNTQIARAAKKIHSQVRFALTGTPIENRLSELWSIFDFLMPGYLYHYAKFKREMETPIVQNKEEKSIKRLQRMMKPFVLRRVKQDVLKELPQKVEQVVYTKLEGEQKKLYMAAVQTMLEMLRKKSSKEYQQNKLQILAELTKLRQICCAPALYFENYQGESAKLDTAMELVRNAVGGNHKVLIFSQFTTLLHLIEERLQQQKMEYYCLTGSTAKEKRMHMVSSFNENEIPVFLISLKAGGTGLNLTAADMVIHLDPWWNVAAQNQATDRAHRIGQKNTVTVFNLIAKDTIEEKILKMQEQKRDLTEQVLENGGSEMTMLTKEDLLDILE